MANCFGCNEKLNPILTFARPHGRYSRCEGCRKKAREIVRENVLRVIWLAKRRESGGRILHAFERSTERVKKAFCGMPASIKPGSGWGPCFGPTELRPGDDVCDICAEKEVIFRNEDSERKG